MNKVILFACGFVLTAFSANAGTGDGFGLSPFWDWKEINTPHFRIVFPVQVSKQAERVARLYEEAHADLSIDLRWQPNARVNVLLVDNTDAANGLTTPVSRFGMLLYLTPPDPFFSTDYYDDWLKLLVYHEYTHFLNMDPTRGLYEVTRILFGDVLLPNASWPAWMLEGYAVFNETKYTHAGRGRSPYWDGILRTAVEADALNRSNWMTLDQVNGEHPHFPSGETAYLFGYHLMNTVERSTKNALSEMTDRSSARVPFFINGNTENITGKDWYAHWDAWVAATNAKMKAQLDKIKTQPVSKTEVLDETRDESFGISFSPDGQWAAYSSETDDQWQMLKLRSLANGGKPTSVEDKFFGSAISFTPDSRQLVFSSLRKRGNYAFYSDLRAYDIASQKGYWLTDGARVRDPNISKDGKLITFTEASESGTDLMIATLTTIDGRLTIEGKKKIVDAPAYDRVANAKFTPDQKGIVFSWKADGNVKDSLYLYSLATEKASPLVNDGARNRFPAYDEKGTLYYVSDRSGVDNLYRYETNGKSTLVTNVTGALWLPGFRGNVLYASVLSKEGFSIAQVQTFPAGLDVEKVRVKNGEEAPKPGEKTNHSSLVSTSIEDYSALSTLLPRQWAPFLIADLNSTYMGGEIFGYDNTFRHQYFVFAAHDSTARTFDYSVDYENRSFGPTLSLFASKLTSDVLAEKNVGPGTGPAGFTSKMKAGAEISYPFLGTTSTFTPSLGFQLERESGYGISAKTPFLYGRSRLIPEQDVTFEYRNTRSSRLAVVQERGSVTKIGARRYDLGSSDIYKGIFKHTQFLNLGGHAVLFPSIKAMKVNHRDFSDLDASAISRGKRNRLINPSYSDDFDEFGIRGYPNMNFSSLEAYTLAADLKFPVAAIFRGWGTNPLFFEQLTLQLFAEDTYRPQSSNLYQHLPSVGAGLQFGIDALLYIPFTLGVDYHYGFNKDALGQGELFVSVTASSLLPF